MTLPNFSDKTNCARIALALLTLSLIVVACGRLAPDARVDWREECAARRPDPPPTGTILQHLRRIHDKDSRLIDLKRAFDDAKTISEMARAYLDAGFDPNASLKNSHGKKPIHKGADSGTADLARFFVAAGSDHTTSALRSAARYNNLYYARGLIDAGADVNAADSDGETPLHAAALYATMCDTRMLGLLINAGADVNAKTSLGYTPLHHALRQRIRARYRVYMHDVMVYPSPGEFEILRKLNAARLLIDMGMDVNAKDSAGETPLHIAARGNMDEIAVALILAGADANAKDNSGETPLHAAASENKAEAADALIAAGANIHAKDNAGATPLHAAVISRSADMVEILIAAGADIHAADLKGNTPASIVAAGRNYDYAIVALTQNNKAWMPATLTRRAYALAKQIQTQTSNKARALLNLPRRGYQAITGIFRVESGS